MTDVLSNGLESVQHRLQSYGRRRVQFRAGPELDIIMGAVEAAVAVGPESRSLGRQHPGGAALERDHGH
eukprot:1915463-Heterocapsa_arctica.AAC.2